MLAKMCFGRLICKSVSFTFPSEPLSLSVWEQNTQDSTVATNKYFIHIIFTLLPKSILLFKDEKVKKVD